MGGEDEKLGYSIARRGLIQLEDYMRVVEGLPEPASLRLGEVEEDQREALDLLKRQATDPFTRDLEYLLYFRVVLIGRLRAFNVSWAEIGRAMNMSPQGVQKMFDREYGHHDEDACRAVPHELRIGNISPVIGKQFNRVGDPEPASPKALENRKQKKKGFNDLLADAKRLAQRSPDDT